MVVIYHPDYLKHMQYPGHPESPERLIYIVKKLKEENMDDILTPEPAPVDAITSIHKTSYVEHIRDFGEGYYDMDTYIRSDTFRIASLAVGGTLLATKYSYDNSRPSFAVVRPPGHHAGVNYAGGFCYFNNVAIGAESIARNGKKVAIIDIDLHHGNGTSDIFYTRNDVLYISTHLWGIYPGTGRADDVGEGNGKGYNVNIPFGAGCGDASFKLAYERVIEPIVTEFDPSMIFVSLGGDAHYRDILGNLTLSTQGYIQLAKNIMKLNRKCTFVLEGGYDVSALAEIVVGIVAVFYDKEIKLEHTKVFDNDCRGRDIVMNVVKIQKNYWNIS